MSDDKPIALSFDVELWHETDWLKPYIESADADNATFESSVYTILELLEKYKRSATFFVTDTVVRLYPHIVADIARAGHEVGSHGIGHTRLPKANRVLYRTAFQKHIQDIEAITQKKVLGFRAPHFSLTKDSSWMIELLGDTGLKYDSSIMPSRVAEYGYQFTPCSPYLISHQDIYRNGPGSPILEIPVSVYGNMRIPFAGGIYFRFLPYWVFRFFLERALKKSYPPVLYFHPHELDPRTPRIKRGPRLKRSLKYFGVDTSLKKLEHILKHYRSDSIQNIFFQ